MSVAEYGIVIVGTSWGGLGALRTLVGGLPAAFALPLIIVQHRHRDSTGLLASLLQPETPLPIADAEDKDELRPGHIYVAPPDYHLLVERGHIALSTDEPVRYSRPSIDVTLESAALAYGPQAVGVVLTGANADGAAGLRAIVDHGGAAAVQRPDEAESPVMPQAAIDAVPEAVVLPLRGIAGWLAALPVAVPVPGGPA